MKPITLFLLVGLAVASLMPWPLPAQTVGEAKMEVRILDYVGTSGSNHFTVAWVTRGDGTFIKTLRKQGPTWSSGEWADHCGVWNTARNGSQVLDGYSSGTANSYTGTNSPVILIWNGRDASNSVMPDGTYKFWVQYAENSGQGPYTTSGLSWVKGPAAVTNTYPAQGVNFTNMQVTWTLAVPPQITSYPLPGGATVGVAYTYACAASGTAPITFTASGLPPGLTLSSAGVVTGRPTAGGTFAGTLTASNGASPNATQPFSIVVAVVPSAITATELRGTNLVISGTGPIDGAYTLMAAPTIDMIVAGWQVVGSGFFGEEGTFTHTIPIAPGQRYYKLRIP